MLSIVIPAHNEERELPATLAALSAALAECPMAHEVIVVDDSSTDRTAEIARESGARVERVELRQIAGARNAGARLARGELLLFVDADTQVPGGTLRSMRAALDGGAVGGGAEVRWAPPVPFHGHLYLWIFNLIWRRLGHAAGCFLFCRRADFEAVGGFDEAYYASEEIWLSKSLRRRGPFVIIREPVRTSARKVRMRSAISMFGTALRLLIGGPRAWQRREGLELWYDGRREGAAEGDGRPSSRGER
jgi:glycosyltransferase involved in cell wall biosynthesis